NAGVALSPDINSQHWNPSKFAFIESQSGVGISYTPWLRKLVSDINLYYLTGFYRLDDLQVLSASLRYFTLGDITFTDGPDDPGYNVKPNEFALDLAYSRVLSDHLSGSVAFRFIRSDLFQGQENMQAGNSWAADLSFYYKTRLDWLNNDSEFSAGFNVSNIGTKISYDDGNTKQFIPTNMRLGVGYSTEIDEYNSFTFTVDANKLLVPTPPLLEGGTTSSDYEEMYHDMSVTKAIFRSFSDAPGGAKEELQEVCYSLGAEYWYSKQFAVRAGYFHEHENKGNRKIFTAGIGLKFNMLTLDASYIIPVVAQSPLANTIRLSLSVDLDQLIK
ncbi:MAG TPA: type IX secretion system outer membrane channel protein PorV, partial [Marinilabiliaceae bacterium]|nr:type IX secretion system outer membrane channel protein PorV [Marinilabiliaceae bacterium]